MRLPLIVLPLMIAAPAAAQGPAPQTGLAPTVVQAAPSAEPDLCRTATHYQAEAGSWRGERLQPKTLDELPAATAYRTINGCEEPLTAVEYRRAEGR